MKKKKSVDNTPKGLENIVDDGTTLVTVSDIVPIKTKFPTKDKTETVIQEKIVEVIKEVIPTVEVEKPKLEGYELYAKLRDVGFYQGGVGTTMENPTGVDKVYVPEVAELYQSFALNPSGWEKVRDALCRVWIEMHQDGN